VVVGPEENIIRFKWSTRERKTTNRKKQETFCFFLLYVLCWIVEGERELKERRCEMRQMGGLDSKLRRGDVIWATDF
jgi:hypothetical protein